MREPAWALLLGVAVAGCNGSGDDGSGDDDDGQDTVDAGRVVDAGGGGGGGDLDAGAGAFRVTGWMAAPDSARRAGATRVVDHVLAVSPSSQSQARVLSAVGSDGSFSLDIDLAQPWVLVFVDSSRVGADMIAGVFGAGSLDTLAPTAPGTLDLGSVTVADGEVGIGLSYEELLASLSLDPAAAEYLGALDDVCLRYVNPDMDGDGLLDVLQPDGRRFLLDFHVQRAMLEDGEQASVADLVGRFLDPSVTTTSFGGTGVYVSVPEGFWNGSRDQASLTFSGELHYAAAGGGSAVAPAGTPVTGDDLIDNDFGDARGVGVLAVPGFDLPQGIYAAELGDQTVTFTSVVTKDDGELASAEGTLLPFVSFAPLLTGCLDGCAILALDIEWRKRTAAGWVVATDDELAITVGQGGGYASIVVGSETSSRRVGLRLPAATANETVLWQAASAHLEGLDEEEFAALTTDDVCHFGLSYDDRLGMRHFAGIANAPDTCP